MRAVPCEEADAADDSGEAAMGKCEAAKTSVWYRVPSVATEMLRPAAGNAWTSVLGGWSASSLHREDEKGKSRKRMEKVGGNIEKD